MSQAENGAGRSIKGERLDGLGLSKGGHRYDLQEVQRYIATMTDRNSLRLSHGSGPDGKPVVLANAN